MSSNVFLPTAGFFCLLSGLPDVTAGLNLPFSSPITPSITITNSSLTLLLSHALLSLAALT